VDVLMKLMAEVTLPEPQGIHDEPTQTLTTAGVSVKARIWKAAL
jgi:hypothetical protein